MLAGTTLVCDGWPFRDQKSCAGEVTHIEPKGYVYCTRCSANRQSRKLRAAELVQLRAGKPLARY